MAAKSNYFKESALPKGAFPLRREKENHLFGLPPEGSCTYKVQPCDLLLEFYRHLRHFWFHQPSPSNPLQSFPIQGSRLAIPSRSQNKTCVFRATRKKCEQCHKSKARGLPRVRHHITSQRRLRD